MGDPVQFSLDFFDDEPLGFSSFANLDESFDLGFCNDTADQLALEESQQPPGGDGEKAQAKDEVAELAQEGEADRRRKLQEIARSSYNRVRSTSRRPERWSPKQSSPKRSSPKSSPDVSPPAPKKKRVARKPARRATVDHEPPTPYNFERYQRGAGGAPVKTKRRATIEAAASLDLGRPIGNRSPANLPCPSSSPGLSAAANNYDMLCQEGMRQLSKSMKRTELSRRQVAMQRAQMAAPNPAASATAPFFLGSCRTSINGPGRCGTKVQSGSSA